VIYLPRKAIAARHRAIAASEADQAEFDILIGEFVRVALIHMARCDNCQPGQPWCDSLRVLSRQCSTGTGAACCARRPRSCANSRT
jgi:hypothetical protein